MGLDELLGGDGGVKDLGKLGATFRLGLSGAVGEEDVRNLLRASVGGKSFLLGEIFPPEKRTYLDTELIVAVQDLQGSPRLWDQSVAVNQDTIDVKSESHVLCGCGLLLC